MVYSIAQRLKEEEEKKSQLATSSAKILPIAAAAISNKDDGRLKLVPIIPTAPPAEDPPNISSTDRFVDKIFQVIYFYF